MFDHAMLKGIFNKKGLRYKLQEDYYLLTSDKLNSYLTDKQAEEMFYRLVKQLAEKENVTENLKAKNQMLWVQKMNSIRNRALEIVNSELIFTL